MTREEFKAQTFNFMDYTAIHKYICDNASDTLWEKIEESDKNIEDCYMFIGQEILNDGYYVKSGNVGMQSNKVNDEYIFGKAIHYFEEESIKKCTGLKNGTKIAKPSNNSSISDKDAIEAAKKKIEAEYKAELKAKADEEKKAKEKAKEEARAKKEAEKRAAEEKDNNQTSLFDFM